MPFQYTFRADDISTWDVDTRDLLENRDRELELYSTTIDTSFLNLNASNLTSGTVPSARMTGAYTGITSVGTLGSLNVQATTGTAMRITNTGTGNSFLVEDSASTDSTPFVIDASGYVGIGTTTPFQPAGYGSLTIDGSSGSIISGRVAGTETFRLQSTALSTTMNGIAALPIVFRTTNTERMRIDSNGNIGIGTGSPTVKLQVTGSTHLTGAGTFPATGVGIEIVPAVATGTNYIQAFSRDASSWQTLAINSSLTTFGTSGTERMRITSAGLVGIGTNSPSYALHISRGTASVEDVAMAVDVLGGNVGDSAGCVMRAVNTNELGAIRSFVESSYLSSMRFYTAGATNVLSERMCITSAGSVGINTVSPAHTLDVNGTTRVTTGIVSGIGISYPGCTTGGGTANNMGLTWISSSSSIIGTVDNAVSAVLGTVSDRRFKANIETLQDGLSTVKQLRPVTYNPLDVIGFDENGEIIIGDNDPYDTVEGFVADEVEQVAPWLVLGGENGGYQSVNYALITPMLVRAVQELEQRLTELETV